MTSTLIAALFIFLLATLAGAEVINKVPPTLHTPLMSGSNAISGIAVIGALLVAGATTKDGNLITILGVIAIVLATVNVVGGFLVTDRMLQMFKKKESKTT
jgi:H+-translocating NAD(P) transhydrogenase subunit alpha